MIRCCLNRVACLLVSVGLLGCSTYLAERSKLPEERIALNVMGNKFQVQPVTIPPPIQPEAPSAGSLWQPNSAMGTLFVDYKARAVGDIVTIEIVEDAEASNDALTNTGKSSDVSAQIQALLGSENYAPSDKLNPFGEVSGGMENSFTGTGSTERKGKIKAEITARVTEVMGNGNLKILGTRVITINSERQFIVLAGVIRPRDISSDNKISSTRIADAQIVYSGTGVVDEQQRQGILSRIVNGAWPM